MKEKYSFFKLAIPIFIFLICLSFFSCSFDNSYVNNVETNVERNITSKENDTLNDVSKPLISYDEVGNYIKSHGKLPDNFITKSQARKLGWEASKGNLAEVAPGKSIGGDIFNNYEGKLPKKSGRVYYECDINYVSGFRGDDRIIFSNDGLIFKTEDHYQTFTEIK